MTASLPTSVGRLHVHVRPARAFGVSMVGFAVVLPLTAVVAVVVILEWAWLPVAGVVLLGSGALIATWVREAGSERPEATTSATASARLQRLCIQADMPVPELVVEDAAVANAWTEKGRIHVTSPLLEMLDDRELDAVLAHEVAHLARRDAALMEICSAPSRVLLALAASLVRRFAGGIIRRPAMFLLPGADVVMVAIAAVATCCAPPAFAIGWMSRLSLLGISRSREFSADAAAVTLIGRPSALASALLKLEGQRDWAPRSDLREVDAYAVLCNVGARSSPLGRLFSTHPPTERRVKRLTAIKAQRRRWPGNTR